MIQKLPASFSTLPDHRALAEYIIHALHDDERVLGLYLSGSFAYGTPDVYSDLDFYILVAAALRDQIERDHLHLREQAGAVIADFPATHLNDPHQFITFYRAPYPLHVDYQYRIPSQLVPRKKDSDVLILWDISGLLSEWKSKCQLMEESYSATVDELQYFEDRFWAWCLYTDAKIKRGELWEARDAIEYLRGNVLVRLAYHAHELRPEGCRRIDTKFRKSALAELERTLPAGHSQRAYGDALRATAQCYIDFMRDAADKAKVAVQERDRAYVQSKL
ncbi:MAG TPA: hypothetical protein VH640_31055 [Bryobacteraceae bacterium]